MAHIRRNGVTWFTRLLIKLHLRSPRQVDIDEFDQWNIRDALESDSYWNWSNSRIIQKSREEFWEFLERCDRISPETVIYPAAEANRASCPDKSFKALSRQILPT